MVGAGRFENSEKSCMSRAPPRLLDFVRRRARLVASVAAGLLLFLLLPAEARATSRALVAWDTTVLLYSGLTLAMMARSDLGTLRDRARAEDEGGVVILVLMLGAALASFAAIAAELRGIAYADAPAQAIRLGLASLTILCSWFFLNLVFAVHYAHDFYGGGPRRGLDFPGTEHPDYWDFLYFSVTIGAALQTSDVSIGTPRMRRLVLGHTLLAFLFNTLIVALAVNVGAGIL
jgi:uncharacterized membrane protein